MKKAIAVAALLLSSGVVHAQELTKGNLVGTHRMSVKLQPGVTLAQFTEFYKSKVIPEFERAYAGWKVYLVKGIRGEKTDSMGLIIVIKTQADRDRYYNPDGTPNDAGKAASAKVQPISDELAKLASTSDDVYTDWLVY